MSFAAPFVGWANIAPHSSQMLWTGPQVRKEYALHIHAIAFRVIGETFATLPTVQQIVFSGFSQRPDKSTGQIEDQYLLSVRLARDQWSQMNFGNIPAIDLLECMTVFDLRRRMTKTGMFTPINPFERST